MKEKYPIQNLHIESFYDPMFRYWNVSLKADLKGVHVEDLHEVPLFDNFPKEGTYDFNRSVMVASFKSIYDTWDEYNKNVMNRFTKVV